MQQSLVSHPSHPTAQPDRLAITAITAAFLLYLLVCPFAHNFSFIDDWAYYQASERIINGGGFVPPAATQMTLVTHAYWGALFAWLFGLNFTVLTAATLVMSLVALLACYALLRQLAFSPALSGLGVACLGLNYLFVTYSYTFHTDITFLALLLLSLVCYLVAINRSQQVQPQAVERWLLLGSGLAALAFLTRQYGLAVPLAAALWLLFAGRLSWRRAAAVLLIPLATVSGYYLWRAGFAPTFGSYTEQASVANLLKNPLPILLKRLNTFTYIALPAVGLAVPLLRGLRYWWLTGPLAILFGYLTFRGQETLLRDLAASNVSWKPSEYLSQPLSSEQTPLWWLAAALTIWLIGGLVEQHASNLLALLRGRRTLQGGDFCLLVFLGIFLPMLVVSMSFFDRYLIVLLPFVIAAALTQLRGLSLPQLAPAILLLLLGGGYSLLLHLDNYDYNQVRWQAAAETVASGVPLDQLEGGFAWDSYYLFDEGIRRLGSSDLAVIGYIYPSLQVIKPEYVVLSKPLRGYAVLRSYPYFSRLTGFRSQQVLLQRRTAK